MNALSSQTPRRLVKTGVARALRWTGADALFGAMAGARGLPVVLGYHRVVEDIAAYAERALPGMMVSRGMLAQHLSWLTRRFRVVSLDELGERLARGETRGTPLAAVTFDDGYADVYHHAFPLLREQGIPAAVFVVTDLIGTTAVPLHDELYLLLARAAAGDVGRSLRAHGVEWAGMEARHAAGWDAFATTRRLLHTLPQDQLRRLIDALHGDVRIDEHALRAKRPLTWAMIAEMSSAGITIGSHTRTHPVLTREDGQKVSEELAGSRQTLERRLGARVQHFAYPDGHFNREVVRAVAEAGYRFGYATCRHRDPMHPLLTIPRTVLWEGSCLDARGRFSPAIMSCQIRGVFAARCRAHHGAGVRH